jgi:hypothetical protein
VAIPITRHTNHRKTTPPADRFSYASLQPSRNHPSRADRGNHEPHWNLGIEAIELDIADPKSIKSVAKKLTEALVNGLNEQWLKLFGTSQA